MFGLVPLLLFLKNFNLKAAGFILFILRKNTAMKNDLARKDNNYAISSKRILAFHGQQIFQF